MRYLRSLIIISVVFVVVVVLVDRLIYNDKSQEREISYSAFLHDVDQGKIEAVTISGSTITGTFKGGGPNAQFLTDAPNQSSAIPELVRHGVRYSVRNESRAPWLALIFNLVPFLLLALLLMVIFRLRATQAKRHVLVPEQPLNPIPVGGYVNADGTVAAGGGFTVSHDAPGTFTIDLTRSSPSNTVPVLAATPWGSDGPAAFITVEPQQSAARNARFIVRINDESGLPLDRAFTFLIVSS